jgi:DNA-binding NarL/FixJ family response regulator
MATILVNSPFPVIAEALGDLLRSLGYRVDFEAGPEAEAMLCDLSGSTPPYPPAPSIPTLALVSGGRDEELAELLLLGYRGYLPPYSDAHVLKVALTALARGEVWASRRVSSLAIIKAAGGETLDIEEARVAALARQGLSNREIAAYLGITEAMVKRYLSSSYQKLGVGGRRDLFLGNGNEA